MKRAVFLLTALLATGCKPTVPAVPKPSRSAPLAVDGTKLFVPVEWGDGRSWYPRPWQNGLLVSTGGWCSFTPWLGPIASIVEPLPPGQFYRADSAGQHKRPGDNQMFFYLDFTFESPLPSAGLSLWRRSKRVSATTLDTLSIGYHAPMEKTDFPYVKLLEHIGPNDGEDVGDGWREIKTTFKGRKIAICFDARDWLKQHGSLPRRLASSDGTLIWYHFERLETQGWIVRFMTQGLPINQWNGRYSTSEELFHWLRTAPDQRDPSKHFVWWSDLRYRPAA